ncbi:MAG: O-antigen ligase family protein [Crocinitomicaceae bacterium]
MKQLTFFRLNIIECVFAGLFFVLILFPKFTALYIGVMILTVVYAYVKKQLRFQFSFGTIGFVLLYLAYLIGVIWTQDPKQANFYVVNKLAFVIFPFLLAIKKKNGFKLNILLWGLIIVTLITFVYGVLKGIPCFWTHRSIQYCFMRGYLYPTIHPTYMTVLVQFSIIALFRLYAHKEIKKRGFYLLTSIFVLYTLLLMSLSGILFLVFMIFCYVICKAWCRFNRKLILLGIPVLLLSLFFILSHIPYLKKDIDTTKIALNHYFNSPSQFINELPAQPSGSEVRLVMWTVSWDEISKHPMGIGTGNVDIYLGKNLRDRGMNWVADQQYNPHNQFLQTTLEVGFLGGLFLLLIVILGFIDAKRIKSWALFFLFTSLLLNSCFESMLQHQSGIIFFPFVYMMYLIDFNSNKRLA